jgi:hypothetical protein
MNLARGCQLVVLVALPLLGACGVAPSEDESDQEDALQVAASVRFDADPGTYVGGHNFVQLTAESGGKLSMAIGERGVAYGAPQTVGFVDLPVNDGYQGHISGTLASGEAVGLAIICRDDYFTVAGNIGSRRIDGEQLHPQPVAAWRGTFREDGGEGWVIIDSIGALGARLRADWSPTPLEAKWSAPGVALKVTGDPRTLTLLDGALRVDGESGSARTMVLR